MPEGWYGFICAICFKRLTVEECAVDSDGVKWDVHAGDCAREAGMEDNDE